MEDTRYWAALALSAEEKMSVEDPLEMEKLSDQLPAERAAKRWIVSADPDEQVERIRPYVELGFRHLVFHAPGPDQARFLRLYAERVVPRLRAAFRWPSRALTVGGALGPKFSGAPKPCRATSASACSSLSVDSQAWPAALQDSRTDRPISGS